MTTDEQARKIAKGLSEAMKAMIADIGDGKPCEFPLGRVGFALLRRGLVFVNDLGARHLTDDGLAVRKVLQDA